MPPVRISRTTKNRFSLYSHVESISIEMSPYSCYSKYRKKYIVALDSSRCAKCILASGSTKYDVLSPLAQDWSRLEAEEERLNDEEAKTTAILAEAAAKLARL